MQGSSVLVPPEFGTFGNAGRNIFNEAPLRTWDFSILKSWKFKERLNVQFRAEFFNVLNHPVFGSVDAGHLANNDPSVGVIRLARPMRLPTRRRATPYWGQARTVLFSWASN